MGWNKRGTGMGWTLTTVKDLHKLSPSSSSSCLVAPAVKIRVFFSNSNSPLDEYLCYRFRDSSFYFLPKRSKNLRRVTVRQSKEMCPFGQNVLTKLSQKSTEFLNCLRRNVFHISSHNLKSRPKRSLVSDWNLQNWQLPPNWCMYVQV